MLRHQLAVYSPLSVGHVARAAAETLMGSDSRARLASVLCRDLRADQAVLFGSGTHALQVAIETARARRGKNDLVALPAFGCFDLASAAVGADARIALYDLNPETLGPDWESFERTLAAGAGVVVVAAYYGVPVDWEAAEELARSHGAVLVEDAAQGHGASWRGRPLGSLGPLSVVSFGRGKGWTGGRGGALLIRGGEPMAAPGEESGWRDEMGTLAGSLAQALLGRPSVYGLPMAISALGLGETRYHPPSPPRLLPRSAASMLSLTRSASDLEAKRRCAAAERLINALNGVPHARPIRIPQEAHPGFLRLPLRLPWGIGSFAAPQRARHLGAAASYPHVLAALPAVKLRLQELGRRWPGADELVRTLVTLPTHSYLTERGRRELLRQLAA